jgi:hypothetical protein
MAQFKELQELWQGQAGPPVSADEIAILTRCLRSYGRRQYWINSAKLVLSSTLLGWCMFRSQDSISAMAGVLLIAVAVAAMLTQDWRNQREIARLDFSAPSLGFVRGAIDRLMQQRDPFRQLQWPALGAIVIGVNLILEHSRPMLRISESLLPFAGYQAGMWVRRKRFEAECRPLIRQLQSMQAALEERYE